MTKDEIIEKLTAVANRLNIDTKSIWVVFLINLAAEVVFLWQGISEWKVLEASLSRCILVNSALQHASDLGYCTHRGNLPRITVDGARPLKPLRVNKFDLCADLNGYKLYFAEDYSFDFVDDTTRYSFDLIVSQESIKEIDFSSSKLYWDLSESCTMDILLKNNNTEIQIGQHLRDFSQQIPILQTTIPNYCLRLINYNIFSGSDTYNLKYFKYPEEDFIDFTIESLPQFKDFQNISYGKFKEKVSDIETIKLGAVTESKSNFLMATTSDIENFILTSPHLDGIKSISIEIGASEIKITYLMENISESLSQTAIQQFVDDIQKAYYITQTFNFVKATEKNTDMQIKIVYKEKFNQFIVTNYLKDIEFIIGKDLIFEQIQADLVRMIPQIAYVYLTRGIGQKVTVLSNEHIKFQDDAVVYQSYPEP